MKLWAADPHDTPFPVAPSAPPRRIERSRDANSWEFRVSTTLDTTILRIVIVFRHGTEQPGVGGESGDSGVSRNPAQAEGHKQPNINVGPPRPRELRRNCVEGDWATGRERVIKCIVVGKLGNEEYYGSHCKGWAAEIVMATNS